MTFFPVFLSVVLVVRNQSSSIKKILSEYSAIIAPLVNDYELIIVDNASDDNSISVLKALTGEFGLPSLQVYALTKEVDTDTASWVGLENELGDFVVVIDPFAFLPEMLNKAVSGADVVFANNKQKSSQSPVHPGAYTIFNGLCKWFNDIHLAKEAPRISRSKQKCYQFRSSATSTSNNRSSYASSRSIRS